MARCGKSVIIFRRNTNYRLKVPENKMEYFGQIQERNFQHSQATVKIYANEVVQKKHFKRGVLVCNWYNQKISNCNELRLRIQPQ